MSSTSQPQPKRARTRESGSHSQGPQEELSQVTGLVEKRRLQNRISQRNYRNKIRDRLEALEALVDRSVKSDPVNVSTASLSRTSRDSTARDEALHQSRTEPPAQGHLTPSSPSAEHTRQWDSMHDFLDGPAAEFDSIYDFTDLQTSVEQYHPDTMRPDRFPNSTETMAASLLSPASTSYPTPPKKSESVNSDEQPISGKLSGTLDILAVAPENINENVSLEQQEQQKHYTVYKPPYPHSIPIPYPLVNTAIYPPDCSVQEQRRHEVSSNGSSDSNASASAIYQRHVQAAAAYLPQPQYVWIPVPVATLPFQSPLPQRQAAPGLSRRESDDNERQ